MGKRSAGDPCIKVCKFDHGVCRGCRRTRDEVKGWKGMTDEQRTAVVMRIGQETGLGTGLPSALRGRKLTKLDRKIAELEAKLGELRRKRAEVEEKRARRL